jgi:serine-type D-Ala-D-Ala carboxypeptidase (penicillin-binding protein 5/6)
MRIRVVALICALPLVYTPSHAANPAYESSAPIAYMVDMSSGAVLYDKNSAKQIPPASMAKMMTGYVIFDLLESGKLKREQMFTVTPEIWKAWNNVGSTMFLKSGEKVSVANLLHGTLTLSGNDSSITLASGIAGSEAGFVALMNAKARALGMKDSHFGTANGWPDAGRTRTTARDLAILASRTIYDFPAYYREFYGKSEFRWGNVTQPDRNPILGKVEGADGLKTGHTDEAGYCFTGSAEQGGRRLMMIVAGLGSFNDRISESTKFMLWGFAAWHSKPLFKSGSVVASAPVQLGNESSVSLIAPRALAVTLPNAADEKFKLVVRYSGPIKAPFAKGAHIADLVVKRVDGSEQIMPLVAAQTITQAGFFGRAWNGAKSIFGL